jgi:serine/threonine protein kinase
MALVPGTLLGHYEITGSLGAGGMGEVYRAVDRTLGRDVALKVLPDAMAHDPDLLDRFRREARAVAALNHPHIVTIYSVEQSNGVHFLTMELVDGTSLDKQIPSGGLPVDALMTIASQLADALAAAHEKSIVHRDLKPANVMMSASGRVKILDSAWRRLVIPPYRRAWNSRPWLIQAPACFSGRCRTCRPSRWKAVLWTPAPTSSRWA